MQRRRVAFRAALHGVRALGQKHARNVRVAVLHRVVQRGRAALVHTLGGHVLAAEHVHHVVLVAMARRETQRRVHGPLSRRQRQAAAPAMPANRIPIICQFF